MIRVFVSAALAVLLVSCVPSPTRIKEGQSVPYHRVNWSKSFEAKWNPKDNFLLLDARPSFEVSISRLLNSVSVRFEDYQVPHLDSGDFERELGTLARRLALKGIEPDRKIWVVGEGVEGDGSELYFVWLLSLLGVKSVAAVPFSEIKWPVTTLQNSNIQNASPWSPRWTGELFVKSDHHKKSPYRGVNVPYDLLIVAVSKDAPQGISNRTPRSGQGPIEFIVWSELYTQDLQVQLSKVSKRVGAYKSKEVWIGGGSYREIAAVFLALSTQGFSNLKLVSPSDLESWL